MVKECPAGLEPTAGARNRRKSSVKILRNPSRQVQFDKAQSAMKRVPYDVIHKGKLTNFNCLKTFFFSFFPFLMTSLGIFF